MKQKFIKSFILTGALILTSATANASLFSMISKIFKHENKQHSGIVCKPQMTEKQLAVIESAKKARVKDLLGALRGNLNSINKLFTLKDIAKTKKLINGKRREKETRKAREIQKEMAKSFANFYGMVGPSLELLREKREVSADDVLNHIKEYMLGNDQYIENYARSSVIPFIRALLEKNGFKFIMGKDHGPLMFVEKKEGAFYKGIQADPAYEQALKIVDRCVKKEPKVATVSAQTSCERTRIVPMSEQLEKLPPPLPPRDNIQTLAQIQLKPELPPRDKVVVAKVATAFERKEVTVPTRINIAVDRRFVLGAKGGYTNPGSAQKAKFDPAHQRSLLRKTENGINIYE